MSNLVFPVLRGLEWDLERSVLTDTTLQRAKSGRAVRLSEQQIPLWKWTLSVSVLDKSKLQAGQTVDDFSRLFGFYMQMKGGWDNFLYEEPSDCQLTDENIGTGNGSTTVFQVTRTMGVFKESIYEINPSPAPIVKVNGVTKTVTTDYTINSSTGVITFVVAPPNTQAVTVTLKYYFRCYFSDEDMSGTNGSSGMLTAANFANNLWEGKTIVFVQEKP